MAVVITQDRNQIIKIFCKAMEQKLIYRTALVTFEDCVILDETTNLTMQLPRETNFKERKLSIDMTPPEINIDPITDDPDIARMEIQLKTELETNWFENSPTDYLHYLKAVGLVAITIIASSVIIYYRRKPTHPRSGRSTSWSTEWLADTEL